MQDRMTRAKLLLSEADRALASGDRQMALGCYRDVLDMGLESAPIHTNVAQCLKREGDLQAAFRHFDRAFQLRRGPRGQEADHNPVAQAHLQAQLLYLGRAAREAPVAPDQPIRCLFRPDIAVPPQLLNPALQVRRVPLGGLDAFYVFDDLLGEAALVALNRLLLESTFWFDGRNRDYLGAHLHDGLATPLMLAVVRAMQAQMIPLTGAVQIAQLWAFRYLEQSPGIDIHADQGDWNFNLWPVSAEHLLEGEGGMTIYDLKIGEDIPFADYNARPDLNRGRIEAVGAAAHLVPYRGNRAVLFPSKYLHKTNAARFSERFEGHRMNVTLMADRL